MVQNPHRQPEIHPGAEGGGSGEHGRASRHWASHGTRGRRPDNLQTNVARNSHAFTSNVESTSLELQRFRVVSKNDRGKLRAKFVWTATCSPPAQSSTRAR